MAPFRNRDRSNRSGRGQVEHNVLDGLPIQQYKEVEFHIGQNTAENKLADKDSLWPELSMPRESHLLPEHSQQLLRAARAGRVFKAPAPQEEDRENMDEEEEQKDIPKGFTVKKWIKVARHLEEPETEYLAKRRKGLPSQFAATNGNVPVQPPPLRETIVKKLDSEGNVNVYKALVPEGQTIEGEVQPTEAAVIEATPAAVVPGTVIEGVGIVNADGVVVVGNAVEQTPARRKPPPPKKKVKKAGGPGRGKKKVVFVEGQAEQGTPVSAVSGSELLVVPDVKPEVGSVEPSEGGDTPMPDAGEEEDEGEDESEEEEGEEKTHTPTPAKSATSPKASEEPVKTPEADEQTVPEPVTEAAVVLGVEPVSEAVAQPVDQSVIEPVIEPIAEPVAEPVVEPIVEPVAEPVSVAAVQAIVEPVTQPLEPVTTAVSEPVKIATPPPPIDAEVPLPEASPVAAAVEDVPTSTVTESVSLTKAAKSPSSSPELPLSAISHSRQNSLNQIPTLKSLDSTTSQTPPAEEMEDVRPTETEVEVQNTSPVLPPTVEPIEAVSESVETSVPAISEEARSAEVPKEPTPEPKVELAADTSSAPPEVTEEEPDLLGSLEAHLAKDSEAT
ncbi:hypothetical protein B0J11DRAFT_534700 [Dendryphion nanum]|uniref:Zonadhesin n=1 Tax=Dendryphion nanum TaxID=256645 RepID=A0A9P9IFD7_9PLEO|nr:hypothetical protein B0J11DRAFT_534700 [Dendryphion nanum]